MIYKEIKKIENKSYWEYLIERFSEVLNMQHRYSIFLLIDEFYLIDLSSLNSSMNKDLFKFIE